MGRRKSGAWDVKVWFSDGSRCEWTSREGKTFTNAEILEYMRKIVTVLERAAQNESDKAALASARAEATT
jgi:hypothetical protein